MSTVGRSHRCFVIMPFGEKPTGDGAVIDFDHIYRDLIVAAVDTLPNLKFTCIRADAIPSSGVIHKDMIEHIVECDIVIVDISTLNPNVLYELGVRHALRKASSIILKHVGTNFPFNIRDMRSIVYDPTGDPKFSGAKSALRAYLEECVERRPIDSLVHTLVTDLQISRDSLPLNVRERVNYRIPRAERKRLGFVTGALQFVRGIDAWVNPENTRMAMPNVWDESVSSVIRYLAADRKWSTGEVGQDIIGEYLFKRTRGQRLPLGTVIDTKPGRLDAHGVKRIFHVSVTDSEPFAWGFRRRLDRGYPDAVQQVLRAIEQRNRRRWARPMRSVLFPLFHLRGAAFDADDVVFSQPSAAKHYLEETQTSVIADVLFLASSARDRDMCIRACADLDLTRDDADMMPIA